MSTTLVVIAVYVAVIVVLTGTVVYRKWYLISFESRGNRTKQAVIVLALFGFLLVAWYVLIWWALVDGVKAHRKHHYPED